MIKIFSGENKSPEELEIKVNEFEKEIKDAGGKINSIQGLQRSLVDYYYHGEFEGEDKHTPYTITFYDVLVTYEEK